MPIQQLPIIGQYNLQRFAQFSPEDAANFYVVKGENTKRPFSLYPTMGRRHVNYQGLNRLLFPAESRGIFRSLDFWYNIVGNSVIRVDQFFNEVIIGTLQTSGGNVFFTYLVVNKITFACFVDNQKIYVYQENTGIFYVVTDPLAPGNSMQDGQLTKPGFIIAFGNRIAVSVANSSQFFLSVINLLTVNSMTGTSVFDPAHAFEVGYNPVGPVAGAAVFAQENGVIRQFAVLNNTLYIFTPFSTGVWANSPAIFSGTGVYFPWKKNSTYDFNFGMADPLSLDVDFNRMVFLGQNSNGLLQVMQSSGAEPERISSKAIDVLFQRYANDPSTTGSPFLEGDANGFLYQYENTIFYRLSAGPYNNEGVLDLQEFGNSIEYNFETKTWHRGIELNGERNRIKKHIFFGARHLVSVLGESTIYEMSGAFYDNEVRNPNQTDPQAIDAYIRYPFRYERITPIISEEDYSEFEDEYVEIDFVFGEGNITRAQTPFQNAVYIIDEDADTDGNPIFIISDGSPEGSFLLAEYGNTPQINETIYNQLFKPHIELYWSDDGGKTYYPADVREFAQMGQYQWRMRWYQLGPSRNRCYKLICVSPVPIVILGGTRMTKRISGGAN